MTAGQTNSDGGTRPELPALVVPLLKGVIYRENNSGQWQALMTLAPRVRDYVAVLDLDLVLDESEGYAFLRSRSPDAISGPSDDTSEAPPRLIARRKLSFHVSLLLALLRKKLAEFDASGEATRLILGRDEILQLLTVFLPSTSNEAKLGDQIETYLNKAIELGFLRRLKPAAGAAAGHAPEYEVRRILKAFVDAQWLADFDARLAEYQQIASGRSSADA